MITKDQGKALRKIFGFSLLKKIKDDFEKNAVVDDNGEPFKDHNIVKALYRGTRNEDLSDAIFKAADRYLVIKEEKKVIAEKRAKFLKEATNV